MLGLILACAFADTTQMVEAKMPTLATITARFIVYLPFRTVDPGTERPRKNNVPNYMLLVKPISPSGATAQTRTPPECVGPKGGLPGRGFGNLTVGAGRTPPGKTLGAAEVPHGTSDTTSP